MNIDTTLNYSSNFEIKKRKLKSIKFIIFHYTGMRKETDAINRLTSNKSKVSSHYFIRNNGEILTLVPDLYIAWHAGFSQWKNYKFINKNSIGIEISNPGHDYTYKKFNEKQIKSVLKLTKFLIRKYKIKSKFILGHSDISPDRKKDPGEKFPWKYLSKKKIGHWHNINQKILLNGRNQNISKSDKNIFIKNLSNLGYVFREKNKKSLFSIIKAFQRHFRKDLINGIIDRECFIIAQNLQKKRKNS